MSRHDLLDAITDGFSRLVELAPHFEEATIQVNHNDASDWTAVGDDLRDAMSHQGDYDDRAGYGFETEPK